VAWCRAVGVWSDRAACDAVSLSRCGGDFQISTATYEEILGLWWNELNATSANQMWFT